MKRSLFFLIMLLVVGVQSALAQQATAGNDPLLSAIRERERLVRAYEQTSAQRNGLFGKKASKKDLNQVNAALRRIIRKDSEILQAVKQRTLPKLAQVEVARVKAETKAVEATNGQYAALENQIEELQIREMEREKLEVERETRLLIAQAAAAEAQQVRTRHEMIAVGLALLSAGLLGYILWQRRSQGFRRPVPLQRRSRPLAE